MTQEGKIVVVAGVISTSSLTLYKQDGTTVVIKQGDPRIRGIVAAITPAMVRKEAVEVDLSFPQEASPYKAYEEKSNGFVRFFRIAKEKVLSILGKTEEPIAPQVLGQIPPEPVEDQGQGMPPAAEAAIAAEVSRANAVVDEIMAHAKPSSNKDNFDQRALDKAGDTVVAVVGTTVIEGVQALEKQIKRANTDGNQKGMEAFLARISKVIDKRRHSIDDLLKFLSKADLQIADDGCIVIYKLLNDRGDHFVDVHSGRVTQRVGDRVCMDESMVDPDRGQDCSNGLHVARRQYLSGFSGDVCVLAKVAPEDVIAVPQYDANKMRVCAYHILSRLDKHGMYSVKRNESFAGNADAETKLAAALRGHHPLPLREVRIRGQKGTDLLITDLRKPVHTPKVRERVEPLAEADGVVPPVDPMDVAKTLNEVSPTLDASEQKPVSPVKKAAPIEPAKPMSRNEQAQAYAEAMKGPVPDLAHAAAQALYELKKKAKVSWTALGVDSATIDLMGRLLGKDTKAQPAPSKDLDWKAPTPVEKKATKPKSTKVKAPTKKPAKPAKAPVKKATKPKTPTSRVVNDVQTGLGSYSDRIAALLPVTSVGAADAVWKLKTQAKKSLAALNVPAADADQVERLRTKK